MDVVTEVLDLLRQHPLQGFIDGRQLYFS